MKNEEWKMKIEYYEEGKLEYGDNWIYEEKFEEEILALKIEIVWRFEEKKKIGGWRSRRIWRPKILGQKFEGFWKWEEMCNEDM